MAFYIESGSGRQIDGASLAGIDPAKTYIESGTGKAVLGSQLVTNNANPIIAPTPTTPAITPAIPAAPAAPSLAQTGTFSLPAFQTAPPTPPTTSAPNLPAISGGSTGSLTDFANALDAATNLAKEKRNALGLGMMMPQQGTLMASDFNSILSNMNRAGDNTASNLTNRAMTAATPNFKLQQFGNDTYQVQYDANGQALAATKIFSAPANSQYSYSTMTDANGNVYALQSDPSGKPVGQQLIYQAPSKPTSVAAGNALVGANGEVIYNNPTATAQNQNIPKPPTPTTTPKPLGGGAPSNVTAADKADIEKALRDGSYGGSSLGNAIGSDGYIDPYVYVKLMTYWIQQGGTKASFLSNFPYAHYINPAAPQSIWDQLGVKNPNAKATTTTSSSTSDLSFPNLGK